MSRSRQHRLDRVAVQLRGLDFARAVPSAGSRGATDKPRLAIQLMMISGSLCGGAGFGAGVAGFGVGTGAGVGTGFGVGTGVGVGAGVVFLEGLCSKAGAAALRRGAVSGIGVVETALPDARPALAPLAVPLVFVEPSATPIPSPMTSDAKRVVATTGGRWADRFMSRSLVRYGAATGKW